MNDAKQEKTSGELGARETTSAEKPRTDGIFFGGVPANPTRNAIDGIQFDFNDGLRVKIPEGTKSYRLRFCDPLTKSTVYDVIAPPGSWATSLKKYFLPFSLIISDPETDELLYLHDFDAKDKIVVVRFPVHTLGDTIGWFSYLERFQKKLQCNLHVVVSEWFSAIVKKQYPEMTFLSREQAETCDSYANYNIGIFELGNTVNQKIDHRYIGLHRLAASILDVDDTEIPPRFDLSAPRRIAEPYVCIGVQSTGLAKLWNNPTGWDDVVAYFKAIGFRVLCIDKDRVTGKNGTFNKMPSGAEDFTGDRPLQERIDLLKDAACFVGLSSGLSWLAWGCRIPVVMISGFTNPLNEFTNPYRVINYNSCNSCWNDLKEFDLTDYWHCPRLKGSGREFECTGMITSEQVIGMIEKALQK